MKKEDKKTILISLAFLILVLLFFAFAPDMNERTKAVQAYQQPTENSKKSADKEDYYIVLTSWTERDNKLMGNFYFVNNLNRDVTKTEIKCMAFDKNNQLLDTIERKVTIKIPKNSNKKINRLEIGRITSGTTQLGCSTASFQ